MDRTVDKLNEQIRIKQYTHQIKQRKSTSVAKFTPEFKLLKQLDSNDILKRRSIQKKVIEQIKEKQKNRIRRMFKEDLLKIVSKLKKYNISPTEIYEHNLFSPEAYVFGEDIFRSILQ